jgi:hypothetical protein
MYRGFSTAWVRSKVGVAVHSRIRQQIAPQIRGGSNSLTSKREKKKKKKKKKKNPIRGGCVGKKRV